MGILENHEHVAETLPEQEDHPAQILKCPGGSKNPLFADMVPEGHDIYIEEGIRVARHLHHRTTVLAEILRRVRSLAGPAKVAVAYCPLPMVGPSYAHLFRHLKPNTARFVTPMQKIFEFTGPETNVLTSAWMHGRLLMADSRTEEYIESPDLLDHAMQVVLDNEVVSKPERVYPTALTSAKSEQKMKSDQSPARPTYAGCSLVRGVTTAVTDNTTLVCRRLPETSACYEGAEMQNFESRSADLHVDGRTKNVDLSGWSPNFDREQDCKRTVCTLTLACSRIQPRLVTDLLKTIRMIHQPFGDMAYLREQDRRKYQGSHPDWDDTGMTENLRPFAFFSGTGTSVKGVPMGWFPSSDHLKHASLRLLELAMCYDEAETQQEIVRDLELKVHNKQLDPLVELPEGIWPFCPLKEEGSSYTLLDLIVHNEYVQTVSSGCTSFVVQIDDLTDELLFPESMLANTDSAEVDALSKRQAGPSVPFVEADPPESLRTACVGPRLGRYYSVKNTPKHEAISRILLMQLALNPNGGHTEGSLSAASHTDVCSLLNDMCRDLVVGYGLKMFEIAYRGFGAEISTTKSNGGRQYRLFLNVLSRKGVIIRKGHSAVMKALHRNRKAGESQSDALAFALSTIRNARDMGLNPYALVAAFCITGEEILFQYLRKTSKGQREPGSHRALRLIIPLSVANGPAVSNLIFGGVSTPEEKLSSLVQAASCKVYSLDWADALELAGHALCMLFNSMSTLGFKEAVKSGCVLCLDLTRPSFISSATKKALKKLACDEMLSITDELEKDLDDWLDSLYEVLGKTRQEGRIDPATNVNARILHALTLSNGRSSTLAPSPENCLRVLRATGCINEHSIVSGSLAHDASQMKLMFDLWERSRNHVKAKWQSEDQCFIELCGAAR